MSGAPGTPSAVVVGGGIAGAFAAFYLARAGVSVTLFRRTDVAGQASYNNPGGLNPLYGPGIPGPLTDLSLQSFALHLDAWDDIARLSGIDFSGRRKMRCNLVVDDDDVSWLTQKKDIYDATPEFSARWLDAEEVRALEPRVGPTVRGALWVEGDAKIEAPKYTDAVIGAAEALGVVVVADEVTGLDTTTGRVTGVTTASGSRPCDAVVIATGPWCTGPARWLGTPLPMEPVKGDMLLVRVAGGGVPQDLAWRDTAVYQTAGDEVWLGGTEENIGFDSEPSEAARASILERIAQVFPSFADAEVVQQTTGLRPLTPDGLPIVGLVPGHDNVCVALGGGRKGMLFSAAMGAAAADLVTTGATYMAITPCSPNRFLGVEAR